MTSTDKRFAVLIDADNVAARYIKIILDEISNEGEVTYKRIYGDWTKPVLAPWKRVLLEYSVMPIQQYSYTTGKNSSDSAMIIDAMDILYTEKVDGFCLVTSDSDFTRLASRLRESGMMVVGMGEQKTPKAFVSACNKFKYLDILAGDAKQSKASKTEKAAPKVEKDAKKDDNKSRIGARTKAAEKDDKTKEPASEKPDKTPEKDSRTGKYTPKDIGIISFDEDDELPEAEVTSVDTIVETLRCILAEESDDDGWVATSDLGNRLLKRYSDFDVRNYGFTKLTSFLKSLKGFEMKSIKSDNSNVKHVYLRELLPDRE